MKIAFPAQEDAGLDSPVFGHFGSAQYFILVDTDADTVTAVENPERVHLHGQCQPLKALAGNPVDAVATGGIGGGALRKLNQAGVRVLRSVEGSVADNLELVKSGKLEEFSPFNTCKEQ